MNWNMTHFLIFSYVLSPFVGGFFIFYVLNYKEIKHREYLAREAKKREIEKKKLQQYKSEIKELTKDYINSYHDNTSSN